MPTLTPTQLSILRRVEQGHGLFRLLDENLNPLYDFGPSDPVDSEAVEGLVREQALQFHSALGPRLPMRAQITPWGRTFLDDAS